MTSPTGPQAIKILPVPVFTMASADDSGCSHTLRGHPSTGPQSSGGAGRTRNMPLADALDLSNRFFTQSGKPQWKRNHPLLIDALCEGVGKDQTRKRRSSMNHAEHVQSNYGPDYFDHVEFGLEGVDSMDHEEQQQLTAFYRAVIMKKNVYLSAATVNDDFIHDKDGHCTTEDFITETDTHPGNISLDLHHSDFLARKVNSRYSTQSNYAYTIKDGNRHYSFSGRSAPRPYDTSRSTHAPGTSAVESRMLRRNYSTGVNSTAASTSAVGRLNTSGIGSSTTNGPASGAVCPPYSLKRSIRNYPRTRSLVDPKRNSVEFGTTPVTGKSSTRLSSGGTGGVAYVSEENLHSEERRKAGGPQTRRSSMKQKRTLRASTVYAPKSCNASSTGCHDTPFELVPVAAHPTASTTSPFTLAKSKSTHQPPGYTPVTGQIRHRKFSHTQQSFDTPQLATNSSHQFYFNPQKKQAPSSRSVTTGHCLPSQTCGLGFNGIMNATSTPTINIDVSEPVGLHAAPGITTPYSMIEPLMSDLALAPTDVVDHTMHADDAFVDPSFISPITEAVHLQTPGQYSTNLCSKRTSPSHFMDLTPPTSPPKFSYDNYSPSPKFKSQQNPMHYPMHNPPTASPHVNQLTTRQRAENRVIEFAKRPDSSPPMLRKHVDQGYLGDYCKNPEQAQEDFSRQFMNDPEQVYGWSGFSDDMAIRGSYSHARADARPHNSSFGASENVQFSRERKFYNSLGSAYPNNPPIESPASESYGFEVDSMYAEPDRETIQSHKSNPNLTEIYVQPLPRRFQHSSSLTRHRTPKKKRPTSASTAFQPTCQTFSIAGRQRANPKITAKGTLRPRSSTAHCISLPAADEMVASGTAAPVGPLSACSVLEQGKLIDHLNDDVDRYLNFSEKLSVTQKYKKNNAYDVFDQKFSKDDLTDDSYAAIMQMISAKKTERRRRGTLEKQDSLPVNTDSRLLHRAPAFTSHSQPPSVLQPSLSSMMDTAPDMEDDTMALSCDGDDLASSLKLGRSDDEELVMIDQLAHRRRSMTHIPLHSRQSRTAAARSIVMPEAVTRSEMMKKVQLQPSRKPAAGRVTKSKQTATDVPRSSSPLGIAKLLPSYARLLGTKVPSAPRLQRCRSDPSLASSDKSS